MTVIRTPAGISVWHAQLPASCQIVELSLNTLSIFRTVLILVKPHDFLPRVMGLIVMAEGDFGITKSLQDISLVVSITKSLEQGQGLLIVVQGLILMASTMCDVAQAIQGVSLSILVLVTTEHC